VGLGWRLAANGFCLNLVALGELPGDFHFARGFMGTQWESLGGSWGAQCHQTWADDRQDAHLIRVPAHQGRGGDISLEGGEVVAVRVHCPGSFDKKVLPWNVNDIKPAGNAGFLLANLLLVVVR